MLRKLFTNNKGFTLLEAILSIATLAMLSGFILQMFIVASSANVKAQNLDKASVEAMNIIENIKSFDYYINPNETDFFKEFALNKNEGEYIFYKAYDENWNPIQDINDIILLGAEEAENKEFPDNFSFLLKLELDEDNIPNKEKTILKETASNIKDIEDGLYVEAGNMINIHVEVFDLKSSEDDKMIVNYETCKYFSN